MRRKVLRTEKAPATIGPYSQGIGFGDLVFCAGQIPIDPATGKMVTGDIRAEARVVIENLKGILQAGGSGIGKVLRLDVYLTDMGLFPDLNEFLSEVFTVEPPARVTIGVSALPMGARIEMAAIGTK
jgi:2-iminobutanoate/2-iminopropanoate deaminase